MEAVDVTPIDPTPEAELSEPENREKETPTGERSQYTPDDQGADERGSKKPDTRSARADEKPDRPTDKRPKTVKVKVDGVEKEVPIDQIVRDYQKFQGSNKKFEEAAALRKENEAFREQIQGFFKDLQGGDANRFKQVLGSEAAEALAEKILIDKMNYEGLTDEQRELLKLKEENARFKSDQEQIEAQRRAEQQKHAEAQAIQQIDTAVTEAFQEDGSKPTPRLVARVAEVMLAHLDHTGGQLDAKKALQIAKRDLYSEVGDYLESLDDDHLLKTVPKSIQERIRKSQLQKAMDADPIQREPTKNPRRRQKTKRMTTNEWFEQMEKKLGV